MEETNEDKVNKIRHRLVDLDISVNELADKMGKTKAHIYNAMNVTGQKKALDEILEFLENA